MIVKIQRIAKKSNYTIGKLYIDNEYYCDTLEDTDRGLSDNMSIDTILKEKIKGETAIPTGEYELTLEVVSPKYSKSAFYKTYAMGGRVPRILGVKGFAGILIHCGNSSKDSEGCILIGENKIKGQLINSQETFKKVYTKLLSSIKKHSPIKIIIE